MKVVWFGREVHHPVLRFLVALGIGLWISVMLLYMILLVIAAAATFWIWLPLDIVLKRYGRRGFVIHEPGGKVTLSWTLKAFRRA